MSDTIIESTRSYNFNIYYFNFSKVYEMAMAIDNHIVKSYQKENGIADERRLSSRAGLDFSVGKGLLESVKGTISSSYSDLHATNTKVVESIEVKTTKSTLLRTVMAHCKSKESFAQVKEGDLIKLDNIDLELLDEESLRQSLVLKRDALKGLKVEGIEINNLVRSMLQDYSYVLIGKSTEENGSENNHTFMLKIPMESQDEFENKYNISDILIGNVSIIGIYKSKVRKESVTANTISFFSEKNDVEQDNHNERIIRSSINEEPIGDSESELDDNKEYEYIDVLAIIQDVHFEETPFTPPKKLHWWNKLGLWLLKVGRDND